MKNYMSDIDEMVRAEQKRNSFEAVKVTVEDVILDLNRKNKTCFAAVGAKAFKASQFVRRENGVLFFKREIDDNETAIKASWIKNLKDVEKVIA